eukprot:gb/GECG01002270.1/.p1 GENE.gb/GECG01002270.1/~~gb/GECG01002270.1/.p1  ORF type:complete len:205 (+),score=12.30 gb/GECG01002270.1/:1-615(+)
MRKASEIPRPVGWGSSQGTIQGHKKALGKERLRASLSMVLLVLLANVSDSAAALKDCKDSESSINVTASETCRVQLLNLPVSLDRLTVGEGACLLIDSEGSQASTLSVKQASISGSILVDGKKLRFKVCCIESMTTERDPLSCRSVKRYPPFWILAAYNRYIAPRRRKHYSRDKAHQHYRQHFRRLLTCSIWKNRGPGWPSSTS